MTRSSQLRIVSRSTAGWRRPGVASDWKMLPDKRTTCVARRHGATKKEASMGSIIEILLGDVPCRIHLPTDSAMTPALLYLHGGTRGVEDEKSREDIGEKLASEARCAVVSIPCPSEPRRLFPATFEHAIGAWAALVERASLLNIDPARLGIAGDGTGAGLAAAVAIACRSAGQALRPRLQILLHPVADNSVTRAHRWSAGELASLPAAFILTAGRDSLLDEGLAYAARLADAGNELTHVHFNDHIQRLSTQSRLTPVSDSVLALAGAFARKYLRGSADPVPVPAPRIAMRD
jgi:acetyl esterase